MGISCGFICGMPVPMKKTLPFRAEPFLYPGEDAWDFLPPPGQRAAICFISILYAHN